MLVLSRRAEQSILIGPDVEVMILEIRDNKVRVGITAPREVDVHRREVFLRIAADAEAKAKAKAEAAAAAR